MKTIEIGSTHYVNRPCVHCYALGAEHVGGKCLFVATNYEGFPEEVLDLIGGSAASNYSVNLKCLVIKFVDYNNENFYDMHVSAQSAKTERWLTEHWLMCYSSELKARLKDRSAHLSVMSTDIA